MQITQLVICDPEKRFAKIETSLLSIVLSRLKSRRISFLGFRNYWKKKIFSEFKIHDKDYFSGSDSMQNEHDFCHAKQSENALHNIFFTEIESMMYEIDTKMQERHDLSMNRLLGIHHSTVVWNKQE